MSRCVGINLRGKQCEKHSSDICEDCGKPVCYFHGDRDKHNCDDSVEGCHSICKHSTKFLKKDKYEM